MRPSDPRLRALLAPAATPLAGVLAGAVFSAGLVIAQAFVLAGFVVAALRGDHLWSWGIAVAAVMAGRAACGLLVDVSAARAAGAVGAHLRRRLLRGVLVPGPAPLPSGEVAALATRGVAAAEPYLTRYLPALVLAGVLPLLAVAATATQDVMSAVIELATLPLIPVFGALIGLATRDRAEAQWRALASLSGHFVDVMRGLPTLVAFRRARAQSATIRGVTHRYRRATMATLKVAFASSAVLELVATLSVALIAVVVGVRLAAGDLDLRTALVCLLLAPEAYWPLRKVGAEFHAAAEGGATFERIGEVPEPSALVSAVASTSGPLQARGLTVGYAGRRRPVLDQLDLTISDRGLTVIAGPSGSGKSTLLAALMGLAEPSAGSITVRGVDAAGPVWQSQVSWMPQRPTFLTGSIAENVRIAAPEATDDDVWTALRQVGLDERVRALPDGVDSPVGEDGRLLSGGERARLSLARVVAARRPWVFLDEPTAHLDGLTERVITDTLGELARSCAVVAVGHSDALLRLADRVIVLDAPAPLDGVPADPAVAVIAPAPVEQAPDDVIPPGHGFGIATLLAAAASLSGVALTATAGWLIVKAAEHPAVLTMLVAIVGVRTFGLARPVLRYVERLRSHDQALRLLAERRVEVYDAVVPLTPGALGRRRGDLLASIVDDVESVVDEQVRVRMPVRSCVIVSVVTTGVASWLLPAAGVVVALTTVVAGGLAWALAAAGGRRAERAAVVARATLAARVLEAVQMAPELVMWQAQHQALTGIQSAGAGLARARTAAAAALGAARAATLLAGAAGVLAMAAVATPPVGDGRLSGPMLALLVLVPVALVDVLLPVADAGSLSVATRAAQRRLHDLETALPVVQRPRHAEDLPPGRDLLLDKVRLGWDGVSVVDGLDLALPHGHRLGVVGPSGSGKSTVGAALLRFVDPLDGEIELDGTALGDLEPDDVRLAVGLVDDDPHVFASTLAANLRLARPGAADADLEQALVAAHLGGWLAELPDGLATWVGDGHAGVSGGERARLALARALLADPQILVLDEPTAHLDPATAQAVSDDVLGAAAGRTIVWITHGQIGLDRMDEVLDLGADRAS